MTFILMANDDDILICFFRSKMTCLTVHDNFCGSIPQRVYQPSLSTISHRCGVSEVQARTFCGIPCTLFTGCDAVAGEMCYELKPNYCGTMYTEV